MAEPFLPPMISYTPNFEDVLLRRCFAKISDGFYVDIGAHHPLNASVTKWLYDCGWSGINVEPGDGIVALREQRPRDINLEMAVSDRIGKATFWVHSGNTGTSTLDTKPSEVVAERAGEIKPLEVDLTTLPAILDEHAAGRHVHVLKIDAEGAETDIIRAADWDRHRPELLVIESSDPYTNIRNEQEWHAVLAANRYDFVYFDGINDFWIREESPHLREFFKVPINVLDFFTPYHAQLEAVKQEAKVLREALNATKAYADAVHAELEMRRAADKK